MVESHSDLFECHRVPGHLVCVSTNGTIKRNGAAVMGRGCALQATRIHPGVQVDLSKYLRSQGNVPGILFLPTGTNGKNIPLGILPVKYNWWEKADLELIRRSVEWLDELATPNTRTIHVPRLGCGNGGRSWEREVRPLMRGLPDNVIVHY